MNRLGGWAPLIVQLSLLGLAVVFEGWYFEGLLVIRALLLGLLAPVLGRSIAPIQRWIPLAISISITILFAVVFYLVRNEA